MFEREATDSSPKKPVISIITVTYNCKTLFEKTLLNIAGQGYANIEHIVVDGASTDGTLESIEENADKISCWISEPDKGIYDAMNKGLKMASGDYILYLNAGDIFYEDNTLERIFESPDGDIYYGQTKVMNANGGIIGDRRLRAPEKLTWKSFKLGMLVCHQSFIVKRELAPEYNLKYSICADIDWCIRCMKGARSIVNTHQYVSCFLEGGLSKQQEKKAWKQRFAIMRKHYGLTTTVLCHFYIAMRYLVQK